MNQPTADNPVTNQEGHFGSVASLRPRRRDAPKATDELAPASTSLDSILQELEQIVRTVDARKRVMGRFVELTCTMTRSIWCGHFQQIDGQSLAYVAEHNGIESLNLGLSKSSVLPVAESAISSRRSRVSKSGDLTVIATPIFGRNANAGTVDQCLCLALNLGTAPVETFLITLQLVATYIARWYESDFTRQLDWQIDTTAAIAELMAEVSAGDKPLQAALLATNRLSGFLNASTVAIGYCRHAGSKRTRIVSISGATEIDRSGEQAQRIESALNETLVRNTITTLPDVSTDPRSMKLAHRQLIESHPDSHLVSAPLTTGKGETIGAWLCLIPAQDNQRETIQFAKVASRYLADALDVSSRAAAGPVARLKQQTIGWASGKVSKILLASLAVIALILMIPVPHRVDCRCTLEPTVRRFAVAPHDGILMESFVKPGDLVSAGQIVARMDDRELNLELSDLVAEREAAIKKRDVNRSARDAAATKISEFEIEQLDAKIQLVRFRLENLEIKTEIDGIVLQGDLENARGAPVRRGDVLAEISPLEQLKLEVDVHETNVNYIEAGQSTSIVLDGSPFNSIKGQIDSVHPMAEVRNDENVFVADVIIPNDDQQLRPGMQGRAKVSAGLRPVGWILFHRPMERVYSIFR